MTEKPSTQIIEHPVLQVMTSLSATIMILLAGTTYLSGYMFNSSIMGAFGLKHATINLSVQDTISLGYVSIGLFSSLMFVHIILTFLIVIGLFHIIKLAYSILPTQIQYAVGNIYRPVNLLSRRMAAVLAFIVLTYGAASGFYMGDWRVHQIHRALHGSCTKCFLYISDERKVFGMPVAQDASKIVIATRNGAVILDGSKLRAIRASKAPSDIWDYIMPW